MAARLHLLLLHIWQFEPLTTGGDRYDGVKFCLKIVGISDVAPLREVILSNGRTQHHQPIDDDPLVSGQPRNIRSVAVSKNVDLCRGMAAKPRIEVVGRLFS